MGCGPRSAIDSPIARTRQHLPMQRIDLRAGLFLAFFGAVVFVSARGFPNVPGQKLGAAFLPMIVGAGLCLCGLLLVWRSRRPPAGGPAAEGDAAGAQAPAAAERIGPPLLVLLAVALYIVAAERLGFLLVAPLVLMGMLRTLDVRGLPMVAWAVGGTLIVHVAFYKLLRVPLPWGVLRPFY